MTTTAIWWIRRDLRLADNQALHQALAASSRVIPVFILDDGLLAGSYTGPKRTAFLFGGLAALDADLRRRGSRLIVRAGEPAAELARLAAETGAQAIFAERDQSPYAQRRDGRVAAAVGVPLRLTEGLSARPLAPVRKDDGEAYTVYTPFSKRWKAFGTLRAGDLLPAPVRLPDPGELAGVAVPSEPALPAAVPFVPGEAEARRRLAAFADGDGAPVFAYGDRRDYPGDDATSQLSPYLRFGMLSLREAAVAAYAAMERAAGAEQRRGAEVWLNELIWREFYLSILAAFPHVRGRSFRPEYDRIRWNNDPADFAAWCAGRTGWPIVDAGMRQLQATGWMHNRVRMITASFLVKDLLIDWRWGERWFMQHLVDGDPAANNGGWQWTAGTGTDAAPYFRIFSPLSQGQKFDPQGDYVRRWVPELGRVPAEYIHAPWTMSPAEQARAGCRGGVDYPAPIVDHGWARERVLAAFAAAKA